MACLVVERGPDAGRSFPLIDGENTIGRGPDNTIQLFDPRVSRNHCRVMVRGGRMLLRECGPANGTRINGRDISSRRLRPADLVELGGTVLRVRR